MMLLGTVIVLLALVLPRLVELPDSTYSGVCAGLLGVGALITTVRGWRTANRMLRERQHEPSRDSHLRGTL